MARYQQVDLGSIINESFRGARTLGAAREAREQQKVENDLARQRIAQEDARQKTQQEQWAAAHKLAVDEAARSKQKRKEEAEKHGWDREKHGFEIEEKKSEHLQHRAKQATTLLGGLQYVQLGTGRFDNARVVEDIKGGNQLRVERAIGTLLKGSGRVLNASANISLDPAPEGSGQEGKFAIRWTKEDGNTAVLTKDGTAAPEDQVAFFSPEEIAGHMELQNHELFAIANNDDDNTGMQILLARNIGKNGADRHQALRDTQAKIAAVQQGVQDAENGMAMNRDFLQMLVNAGDGTGLYTEGQEELLKNAAEELNLELPEILTKPRPTALQGGALGSISSKKGTIQGTARFRRPGIQTTGATVPLSNQEVVADYDSQIESLQTQLDNTADSDAQTNILTKLDGLTTERTKFVQQANQDNFEDVKNKLEIAERILATQPDNQARIARRDNLKREKDALIKAGVKTPAMLTDGYKKLENAISERLKGLSIQDAGKFIVNGGMDDMFSPEVVSALKSRIEEAEITDIKQLKEKLPVEESIINLRVAAVLAGDASVTNALNEEASNLAETGSTSISALKAKELVAEGDKAKGYLYQSKSMLENATANRIRAEKEFEKAKQGAKEGEYPIIETATEDVKRLMASYKIPSDGKKAPLMDEEQLNTFVNNDLPAAILDIRKYAFRSTTAADAYRMGLYSVANQAAASIANKQDGIIADFTGNWFGEAAAPDLSDFDLKYITVDDPEAPTVLKYMVPGQGQAGGEIDILEFSTGENANFKTLMNLFTQVGIANTQLPNNE